jgi:hypothetical protein
MTSSVDQALGILLSGDAGTLGEFADNRSQPVENRRVADLAGRALAVCGDRHGLVGDACVECVQHVLESHAHVRAAAGRRNVEEVDRLSVERTATDRPVPVACLGASGDSMQTVPFRFMSVLLVT